MKKVLNTIFLCLTLVMGLVACDDKHDKIPPTGGLDNAEKLVVGTYTGTWSRTNLSTMAEESKPGSITFSVDESLGNNVTVITVESELDLGLNAPTCAANISRLSSGVLSYWNVTTSSNPFGTSFTGKVSPEGVATMQYNKVVRSGRKEVEFSYTFSGNKQQ